jgi:D-hydroxyproline dehydrogenase subunit alpha
MLLPLDDVVWRVNRLVESYGELVCLACSEDVLTVDVAVVGAGPAGIAAAIAARRAGASVVVIDEYPAPGGQIWKRRRGAPVDALPPAAQRRCAALERCGAELLPGATVWAARDDHSLLTTTAEGRAGEVRARSIVVATGAYDRPVAFPGWTLPGVVTAGAAQTLVKAEGVLPGRRVLLAGAGPFLLPVAEHLVKAGAEVAAVAEATRRTDWLRRAPRMLRHAERLAGYLGYRARLRGVPFLWGHVIVRADGDGRVESATLARADSDWRPLRGTERSFSVDAVATAYGFLPSVELARALGCALADDRVAHDEDMRTTVPHVFVAGEASGIGGSDLALLEGEIAGRAAADGAADRALRRRRRRAAGFARVLDDLFGPRPGLHDLADGATPLCRCEDVTAAELDAAVAAGARTLSALKIATRCGQGPCQGRICAHLVAARAPEPGDARFSDRPPLRPVALSTLVGGE